MAKDDSDVVERSRKLFQDAAPVFMNHYGLWVFSRSLVRKGYSGVLDQDAFDFASYDPLGNLEELPMDPLAGIRCAEVDGSAIKEDVFAQADKALSKLVEHIDEVRDLWANYYLNV